LLLLIGGAALIIYAVATGEVRVALFFFIIPTLYGNTLLGALAILLFVFGLVLLFLSFVRPIEETLSSDQVVSEKRRDVATAKKDFGGVLLIGPIPIVFGSGRRAMLYVLIVMVVIIMSLAILLLFL